MLAALAQDAGGAALPMASEGEGAVTSSRFEWHGESPLATWALLAIIFKLPTINDIEGHGYSNRR